MKKIFLFGLVAAAVLAGCSKDETIEVSSASQKGAIAFDSFVNLSTKGAADDLTSETFRSFQVWGLMTDGNQTGTPFVGTEVTSTDGKTWSYGTPVYWENGYKYSFVAIAPSKSSAWTFTAPQTVGKWGSIAFTNGVGTTDLIYDIDDTYVSQAVSTEDACPNAIPFTFNHLLSRVKFAFTNEMADNSLLEVVGVKILDANNKAIATLGETASWTLAGDNAVTELEFGSAVLKESSSFGNGETASTDHKYMIPALSEGQKYTLQFTINRTTQAGTEHQYNHEVELPDVKWAAGNSYCFTASIDASNIIDDPDNPDAELCPITFTAEVGAWGDFNDNEVTLPEYTTGGGE